MPVIDYVPRQLTLGSVLLGATELSVLAVLVLVAYFVLWNLLLRQFLLRRYYAAQGVPSSSFCFLFGDIAERNKWAKLDQPFRFIEGQREKFGKVWLNWFGWNERIVVCDAAGVQSVLINNAKKYRKPDTVRYVIGELLGNGLVTSEGELWQKQRKLISPAFHFESLSSMVEIMASRTDRFVKMHWDVNAVQKGTEESDAKVALVDGEPALELDLAPALSAMTLNIIAASAFGQAFVDHPETARIIRKTFDEMLQLTMWRATRLISLLPIVRNLPLPSKLTLDRHMALFNNVIHNVVTDRQAGKTTSACSGRDLLDLLMQAKDPQTGESMPARQLQDELNTFIIAGHETTSNLLAWTFLELMKHPEVMQKCREEADSVIPRDSVPTHEVLGELKYIDAVLNETLRFHPPVPLIVRQAMEDTTITLSTGREIAVKAGTSVTIPIMLLHRDEEHWQNPDVFDPDRWLRNEQRHPLAWVPFAKGPRNCIGQNFAKYEAKVMLAMIVQRYDLSLVPGQKFPPEMLITVRPKYGLKIYVKPRK